MSLLEELFGVDEAEEAEALERVIEGGIDDDDERENGDDEAEEERRVIDPTKPKSVRVVKHPRLVLNAARLTGPRGMQTLPEHFKGFKFKGKGHEKEDLDMVLKKLEHWAHRLYPKFQFADCLKKIETLGNKRPVQVTLRKIRSDQLLSSDVVTQRDSSDDEAPPPPQEEDEFDRMLQQQIELARATPHTPGGVRTPSLAPKATSSPSISEEQKQRMLRNRQLAEERKRRKNAPETSVAELTGFSQQVPESVSRTEQVKLTHHEQPAGVSKSTTVEEVDLTGLDRTSRTDKPVTITENVIDMTHGASVTIENDEVIKTKKKTKKNVIIDGSDDEENVSGKSEKDKGTDQGTNDNRPEPNGHTEGNKDSSSDDRGPVSLHYSDSSDEKNATANVSITADVHRGMFSQTTQDEFVQGNSQNGHPSKEDICTSQEAIRVQADIETDLETHLLKNDTESQTKHSTMNIDSIMKEIEHCDEENTVTDTNFDDDDW